LLLQLQIKTFEEYIKDMKSPKIKLYIFKIFNYKIKYKAEDPTQFEKTINKVFGRGRKQQPFK